MYNNSDIITHKERRKTKLPHPPSLPTQQTHNDTKIIQAYKAMEYRSFGKQYYVMIFLKEKREVINKSRQRRYI